MRVSSRGLDIIKAAEGLRLYPYLCSANVWTIGYGSTRGVTKDTGPITKEQALARLKMDVLNEAERPLKNLVHVQLNQNQYDALASLVFNIGQGNFRSSTLRQKLNRGDYEGAAGEFWKWRRAGGRILPGLVKRREVEEKLFRLDVSPSQSQSPGPKQQKPSHLWHLFARCCTLGVWKPY